MNFISHNKRKVLMHSSLQSSVENWATNQKQRYMVTPVLEPLLRLESGDWKVTNESISTAISFITGCCLKSLNNLSILR